MIYNIRSAQTFAQGWKLSIFATTSSILTAALILLSVSNVSASEDNQNYVAPSVGFINGSTLYGVNGKFGIIDNVALRPFIQYKKVDSGSGTAYGASITYNLKIPNSELIPYAGFGAAEIATTGTATGNGGFYFEGGVDYNPSDNLVINANYKTAASTWINIGAGYRF
jgi:hypothetical protein